MWPKRPPEGVYRRADGTVVSVRDVNTLEALRMIHEDPEVVIQMGNIWIRAGDIPGLHRPIEVCGERELREVQERRRRADDATGRGHR